MDPSEALQKYVQRPDDYPLSEVTVDGTEYIAFGDYAFKRGALTSLQVYSKSDSCYSLESLLLFLKFKDENHGVYVKEAAAHNVLPVTRIDRKSVQSFLDGDRTDMPSLLQQETSVSLKKLLEKSSNEPDAKRQKLETTGEGSSGITDKIPISDEQLKEKEEKEAAAKKKEVEIRALNGSLTKDRIVEMRRKRQKNLEKGIVNIDESLSTLTSASLPKTRIHKTRENSMLGVRDLSNVLEVIASAQRQWDLNEKKEKVAAVHASTIARAGEQGQQRHGYSRYAQEAFAHDKTKEIQTEGSFIGSNLSTLKQGHTAQKAPETPPTRSMPPPSSTTKPSSTQPTSANGKRVVRSPIIIVPSAMNTMINLYNAKDILQNLGYVPVEQRRKETNKKPVDLAVQRKKNGVNYNIRIIDNAEKLADDDWDRVIAVFVMGVAWQFKGWKWGGNPTDIFTHVPAFYFHFDSDKPSAQVMQWSVHKIPVSATKRHMDKAKFSQMWETIENFVRKNKPHLTQRLGL